MSSGWPVGTEKTVTPRRLRVTERASRPATWGDRPPVDDDEARRRLLDAAEVCYERRGVSRTTVDDIAKEALVHRTTVYRYFGTRDDVLAFVLLRETAMSSTVLNGQCCATGHLVTVCSTRLTAR